MSQDEEKRGKRLRPVVDALLRTAYRGAYTLARGYWFVRRPETLGVLVGVWHGREVLLLQNSYKRLFSLPGGGHKPGESVVETGRRELHEEVGLEVEAQALRETFAAESRDEYKHDRCHFLDLEVEARPALAIDRREVVWAEFIDVEVALRLPLTDMVRAYLEDALRRRGLTS
jgi:ADP-ribose pyrophosphatase YjhB (NUDIX family)